MIANIFRKKNFEYRATKIFECKNLPYKFYYVCPVFIYERNSDSMSVWPKFDAPRNERVASELTLVERIGEKEERAARTRVTHHRANKRGKTTSKSIRCSEGGGGRSTERTFRQPWMHYLPPGVFYDFLGSHNKVRQREFRTMALRNCPRLLSSVPLVPSVQTSPGIVFAHRRLSAPFR